MSGSHERQWNFCRGEWNVIYELVWLIKSFAHIYGNVMPMLFNVESSSLQFENHDYAKPSVTIVISLQSFVITGKTNEIITFNTFLCHASGWAACFTDQMMYWEKKWGARTQILPQPPPPKSMYFSDLSFWPCLTFNKSMEWSLRVCWWSFVLLVLTDLLIIETHVSIGGELCVGRAKGDAQHTFQWEYHYDVKFFPIYTFDFVLLTFNGVES